MVPAGVLSAEEESGEDDEYGGEGMSACTHAQCTLLVSPLPPVAGDPVLGGNGRG